MDFAEFSAGYEALFGPVSADWRDHHAVGLGTRVIRTDFGRPLRVHVSGDRAELVWHCEPTPMVLSRVSSRGTAALEFMIAHSVFYVRELPGALDDDERISLTRALVQTEILRVAP